MEMLTIESLTAKEHKRFYAKIQVNDDTECWNWIGSKDAAGYGMCCLRGKSERIHRVMFALHIAPLPRGIAARVRHAQRDHRPLVPSGLRVLDVADHQPRADGDGRRDEYLARGGRDRPDRRLGALGFLSQALGLDASLRRNVPKVEVPLRQERGREGARAGGREDARG